MFKQKPTNKTRIETLIGAKTRIQGDVEFAGGLHVDGYIEGDVKCEPGSEGVLSISEAGCIEGSVAATDVILNGIVKGDIEASGRVQLGPRAQVLGSVHYVTIESAVGARITGKLSHRGKQQGATPAPGARGPETGDAEPS